MVFKDRVHAGKELANVLEQRQLETPVVLALPRGGVVLGEQIAIRLQAPLGVVLVKKLSHRFSPEFAIGAVAEDREPLYSSVEDTDKGWYEKSLKEARKTITQRREAYYPNGSRPTITGKDAVIVDDGIATGMTMQAAIEAVRAERPTKIIVAVPIAAQDTVESLQQLADEVSVLDDPANFRGSVGAHYEKFDQVSDDEVIRILHQWDGQW